MATGETSGSGEAPRTLGQALGPPATERLDPGSVAELAALLVDFAASLDQVVWSTWRVVNPNSALKRGTPARVSMARFAAGEPGATREQVKQDLEKLRQLTAALTAAAGQAGRVYGQKHVATFAPAEIEKIAKLTGGSGVMVGQEVKCWRKYEELAGGMDAEGIEGGGGGGMRGYWEGLLKGLGG